MPKRPRSLLRGAQLLLAALLLFFIGRTLLDQWLAFRETPLETRIRWWDIAAASALLLGAHALLVLTWRAMIRAWGAELSFWNAARVWSVSSFGKYVPGKIWQITAMAAMATRAGVSAVVSTGSAMLGTIVNIAVGIGVVLAIGWTWLDRVRPDTRLTALVILGVAMLGLLALPFAVPWINAAVARVTGRLIAFEAPPPRIIVIAIAGNLVAWILYGIAFRWLMSGVLGDAPGSPWEYVAVYAAAYVLGYLVLFLPGGLGVREGTMAVLLTSLAMATPKQALLVAGAARVWVTLLEIVPGLLFVAHHASRRRAAARASAPPDATIPPAAPAAPSGSD